MVKLELTAWQTFGYGNITILINNEPTPPTVGSDMTLWQIWICLYPMPHCGCVCSNSTLIMVPINFWRNSDLFKKKEHLSSSKIDNFRAFQRKSLKIFKENLSNTKQKSLKPFWSYFDDFE